MRKCLKKHLLGVALSVLIDVSYCAAEGKPEFLSVNRHPQSVIIPVAAAREMTFLLRRFAAVDFWLPSEKEIDTFEADIEPYLEATEHAVGKTSRRYIARIRHDLPSSRRQYLGIIAANGRKQIVGNFFPAAPSAGIDPLQEWRTVFIEPMDGGPEFWQIRFDASTRTLVRLTINAVGEISKKRR